MIYKDYIKKMEKDRFAADLKEAQDALANMNGRLHDLEAGGDDKLATSLYSKKFSLHGYPNT